LQKEANVRKKSQFSMKYFPLKNVLIVVQFW